MGFPISKVVSVGTSILTLILRAVPYVQAMTANGAPMSGPQKRATVLELVAGELAAAHTITGRDLANDADVLAAAGTVNDAVVAFHTVLARKLGEFDRQPGPINTTRSGS